MINKDEYDSFEGYVDALEAKIEELEEDNLVLATGKADQQAIIIQLRDENKRLHKDMWAAKYCNPTEDLRLAKLKVEELTAALDVEIEMSRKLCRELAALQAKVKQLTAKNKRLHTYLRIALYAQEEKGFKLVIKQEQNDA